MSRVQIAADQPVLARSSPTRSRRRGRRPRSNPMTGPNTSSRRQRAARADVGEDRGREESPPDEARRPVAGEPPHTRVAPCVDRRRQPALHRLRARAVVDQRAHRHAGRVDRDRARTAAASATTRSTSSSWTLALDEDPSGAGARLTGQREARAGDDGRGRVEVGIGEHDDRVLAAELELHAPAETDRGVDLPTGGVRAGEGDRVDAARRPRGGRPAATPCTTLSTPGGSPASMNAAASRSPISGVIGDGLNTTVLPAASAGPILRLAMLSGKFHGVITATTPDRIAACE